MSQKFNTFLNIVSIINSLYIIYFHIKIVKQFCELSDLIVFQLTLCIKIYGEYMRRLWIQLLKVAFSGLYDLNFLGKRQKMFGMVAQELFLFFLNTIFQLTLFSFYVFIYFLKFHHQMRSQFLKQIHSILLFLQTIFLKLLIILKTPLRNIQQFGDFFTGIECTIMTLLQRLLRFSGTFIKIDNYSFTTSAIQFG